MNRVGFWRAHFYGWGAVIAFLLFISFIDGIVGGGVPKASAAEPVRGWASTYDHTAGFDGQATVALPDKLGGRYDGTIYAFVEVCADRCAVFPAVDWCLCHVEPSSHPDRIVDLSHAAWNRVTDKPFGLIPVTVQLVDRRDAVPDTSSEPASPLRGMLIGSLFVLALLLIAWAYVKEPER